VIFCDTSTLAKYYVPEAETAAVQSQLDAEDIVAASALARVELMAVFHRRLREGKWTRAFFSAVVRQFEHDDVGGQWAWLPLENDLLEAASHLYVTLPDNLFLRSADCLHLITARHHGFLEIHTHDQHQSIACPALGLTAVGIK
jgi:uncharacterized protein